jgi:hypothetical protein
MSGQGNRAGEDEGTGNVLEADRPSQTRLYFLSCLTVLGLITVERSLSGSRPDCLKTLDLSVVQHSDRLPLCPCSDFYPTLELIAFLPFRQLNRLRIRSQLEGLRVARSSAARQSFRRGPGSQFECFRAVTSIALASEPAFDDGNKCVFTAI